MEFFKVEFNFHVRQLLSLFHLRWRHKHAQMSKKRFNRSQALKLVLESSLSEIGSQDESQDSDVETDVETAPSEQVGLENVDKSEEYADEVLQNQSVTVAQNEQKTESDSQNDSNVEMSEPVILENLDKTEEYVIEQNLNESIAVAQNEEETTEIGSHDEYEEQQNNTLSKLISKASSNRVNLKRRSSSKDEALSQKKLKSKPDSTVDSSFLDSTYNFDSEVDFPSFERRQETRYGRTSREVTPDPVIPQLKRRSTPKRPEADISISTPPQSPIPHVLNDSFQSICSSDDDDDDVLELIRESNASYEADGEEEDVEEQEEEHQPQVHQNAYDDEEDQVNNRTPQARVIVDTRWTENYANDEYWDEDTAWCNPEKYTRDDKAHQVYPCTANGPELNFIPFKDVDGVRQPFEPIDFFYQLFPQSLLRYVTQETNRYASTGAHRNKRTSEYSFCQL